MSWRKGKRTLESINKEPGLFGISSQRAPYEAPQGQRSGQQRWEHHRGATFSQSACPINCARTPSSPRHRAYQKRYFLYHEWSAASHSHRLAQETHRSTDQLVRSWLTWHRERRSPTRNLCNDIGDRLDSQGRRLPHSGRVADCRKNYPHPKGWNAAFTNCSKWQQQHKLIIINHIQCQRGRKCHAKILHRHTPEDECQGNCHWHSCPKRIDLMVYKAFGTFPSLGSRYPHFLIRFFKRSFSKHLAQLHDFGVFREVASFDKGDHE